MEPIMGTIILFAGGFAPKGWAICDGSLLSVSSFSALYSLIGTTYGGDGQKTFALPDLRGRVPMGVGQGPGLPLSNLGAMTGTPTTTLSVANMPSHNHVAALIAEGAAGDTANPSGALLSVSTNGDRIYGPDTPASEVKMHPKAIEIEANGGNQPFNNMQPSLGLNYIIAVYGIYPERPA